MSEENTEKPKPTPENTPNIDMYKDVVDHAQKEIEWVRSTYKWQLAAVVPAIAIVIAVGIWFTYASIRDFKAELKESGQTTQQRLEKDLDARVLVLGQKVNDRIDEQFGEDNITSLVAQTAQRRIDTIADGIIEREIANRVTPLEEQIRASLSEFEKTLADMQTSLTAQVNGIEAKRVALDKTVSEARQILEQLKVQSEFTITVVRADHDDREAYRQLTTWADDPSFPFRSIAKEAAIQVQNGFFSPLEKNTFQSVHWPKGADTSHINLENLIESTNGDIEPYLWTGLVILVWQDEKIPKSVRAGFLVYVMHESPSLQAANRAGRLLAEEAKIELKNSFDFEPVFAWYEKNKDHLDDPPAAEKKSK